MIDCVFCRILSGAAAGSFVYRDEYCAVFMDIRPVNPGHFLVVPLSHSELLADIAPDTAAHLMLVALRLAAALRSSGLNCEGVNLLLADGEAAMQEVPHLHLHVIPRFKGDGFGLRFGPDYVARSRESLEAAAEKIRRALAQRDDPRVGT